MSRRVKMNNFLAGAIFMIASIMFVFLVVLIWWSFKPYPTAEIVVPMEVTNENNVVLRPEKLQLRLIIDKQSDYTPIVSRNIFCDDGTTHLIPATVGGTARPRGQYTAEVSYELPATINDGATCVFEFINNYQVNPIKIITKKWQSEPFQVFTE